MPTSQALKWKSESEVAQSCPTLCDPMDCSLPGSSVHGNFQARVQSWVAIFFSRISSQPRVWTQVSRIAADALPSEPPGKTLKLSLSLNSWSGIRSSDKDHTLSSQAKLSPFFLVPPAQALGYWAVLLSLKWVSLILTFIGRLFKICNPRRQCESTNLQSA